MCTVSWIWQPEGYRLWFNRDEQHDRASALPPKIHRPENGLPWLAAIDPSGGGTWLAANAAGLSLGLLNFYERQTTSFAPGARSRGLLITDLIPVATGAADVAKRLPSLDLSLYRAFYLLAWEPAGVRWWVWDERDLQEVAADSIRAPISTSSVEPQAVTAQRQRTFDALPRPWAPEAVEACHLTGNPERPAFGVCMERDDARTVSLSQVEVGPKGVRYGYRTKARTPDGWSSAAELEVERTSHSLLR